MIRTETIDRIARIAFYFGATLLLTFNAWLQVAPLSGTDPAWWDASMAHAAMGGLLALTLAIGLAFLGLAFSSHANRKTGNQQTETSR